MNSKKKIYESLYSNEVAVTPKNKTLIHDYINDNNNNEPPVNMSQEIKISFIFNLYNFIFKDLIQNLLMKIMFFLTLKN